MNEPEQRLYSCFASRKWSRRMAAGWPYADLQALLDTAEQAWAGLDPADWDEALRGHPRIGESGGSAPAASEDEQRGVRDAGAGVLARLAEANRLYEDRFGHVFLIAAAGKGPEEILAALHGRLGNDPVTEAQVAAAEHRKIARMRLEKLVAG